MKNLLFKTTGILMTTAVAVMAFLMTSCERYPKNVEYSQIAMGVLNGNGAENLESQNIVITNTMEWENLIVRMDFRNNVSDSFIEKNIDFDKYMVIVAIDSIRPHSGYSITINQIREFKNNIRIDIVSRKGDAGYNVIVQPFHIVKMPRHSKDVIFESK